MRTQLTVIFIAAALLATTTFVIAQEDGDTSIDPSQLVGLDQVDVPQDTLAAAKVETTDGEAIGEVERVVLDRDGKPATLVIDADRLLGDDDEVIEIEAERLAYLPDENVVMTDLSADEIKSMAQAE